MIEDFFYLLVFRFRFVGSLSVMVIFRVYIFCFLIHTQKLYSLYKIPSFWLMSDVNVFSYFKSKDFKYVKRPASKDNHIYDYKNENILYLGHQIQKKSVRCWKILILFAISFAKTVKYAGLHFRNKSFEIAND